MAGDDRDEAVVKAALAALASVLRDPEQQGAAVRVKAAEAILATVQGLKAHEDMARRLAAVERRIATLT